MRHDARILAYPYDEGEWAYYYQSRHAATGLPYDARQCPRFRTLKEARQWVRDNIPASSREEEV